MDFDQAIQAHLDWKSKLAKYIASPDKSLNAEVICKDNQCVLGKWIYSEGKTMAGNLPDFEKLRSAHADFHKQAAEIVRRADRGEKMTEGGALDMTSPYGKASLTVISFIRSIRKQASKAG